MKRATLLIVTMCFCVSPCIATIVISDTYEYDVKLESSESLLMLGRADSIWKGLKLCGDTKHVSTAN